MPTSSAGPASLYTVSLLLLSLVSISKHHHHVVSGLATNIQYRRGQKSDEGKIASTLAKELMNPLGIQSDRFIVATSTENNNNNSNLIIGWAQIKPLGKPQQLLRDPQQFNARPGSYDLEQEVDDAMWDDFEDDNNIQVPTGMASMPWTKEYRAMSKAVQDRDQKRERRRQQRLQELEQQPNTLQLYELSSVYVLPAFRGQGIGAELVKRVLKKTMTKDGDTLSPTNIYCLTLATTVPWYQDKFGFERVPSQDIPGPMALEVTAGNIITKLVGAELCCMRATSQTLELCRNVPMT